MGLTWVPTAYWLTVKDGIPHRHPSRFEALDYAKEHKCFAFRQDAGTGETNLIYPYVSGKTIKKE